MNKDAVISKCCQYRFSLSRYWDLEKPQFGFFGVNPSTADAAFDDATVRKWVGFTERNGGGGFVVGNLFAFRATDVKELAKQEDPVGKDNNYFLEMLIEEADVLVPCWGARGKLPRTFQPRVEEVEKIIFGSDKPVFCFGRTISGDFKHPLFLKYETKLERVKK